MTEESMKRTPVQEIITYNSSQKETVVIMVSVSHSLEHA